MLSFKVGIFVLAGRESAKEGPIVGWIRTERHFCCLELLLSLFPLCCPEELLLLLLLLPPPLLGAPCEAMITLHKFTLGLKKLSLLSSISANAILLRGDGVLLLQKCF